jgi:hypothetical protein
MSMDLRKFLKRGGRSQSAVNRAVAYVQEFEQYLRQSGKGLDQASPQDLQGFVAQIEREPKTSALVEFVERTGFDGIASLPRGAGRCPHGPETAQNRSILT